MRLAASYSFNKGKEVITERYPNLLVEVNEVIQAVDALKYKDKESFEARKGMLFSPVRLNAAFKREFHKRGWERVRVACEYSDEYYLEDYELRHKWRRAYREMDFVKDRLGIEVQLGKYSFMVYNVSAKMTIFHNLDVIDAGVEIVPVKALAKEMSSGVSYFEQFEWDLRNRGVADIDIPVLILGVDAETGTKRTKRLPARARAVSKRKGVKPGPK